MNQQLGASNVHKVNDGQMAEKPAPGARFAAAYCKEENNNVETGRKGCCVTNEQYRRRKTVIPVPGSCICMMQRSDRGERTWTKN